MSGQVTAEKIALALGVHRTSILRRAEKECWLHVTGTVRGGRQNLYPVLTLPAEVRTPVMALLATEEASSAAALAAGRAEGARLRLVEVVDDRAAAAARQLGLAQFMRLPEARQRKADARAAVVQLAQRYVNVSGLEKRRGQELFAHEYSGGRIEVPEWLRAEIPSVCSNSIDNWAKALSSEGLARLAGKQGEHRRGQGIIDTTPDLRELILGMLVDHPHASAKHVMRAIRARFTEDLHPSYRTLQRWMADWKATNKQLHTAITNPDAWRSKFMAAGGDADAKIIRLNQRWEADSTKGDLLLSDGARHVVVGIIDVYSRRLKLHVSRSSSAIAVAATLRRALVDWGVPEQLGTDNGSDYVSEHMLRVISGLQIDHDLAPPFTPEHKPFIERAFGTFCRDLVELLPGYVGHSVGEAQAIRSRQSFAQRMMKEGGEAVDLRMSPEELQKFCDDWTDKIYALDPHSGLDGVTPFERASSWSGPVQRIADERALDVLLAPAPGGSGIRTITKKGIRLDNALFEAPELGGLEGQDVRILLDEADIGEIYVFDLDGKFIVKALCPERTGISRQELVAKRKAVQKAVITEGKKVLKAIAKKAVTEKIVPDIIRERATAAGKLLAFPGKSDSYTTPDLEAAAIAARADRREEAPVPVEVAARRASLQTEIGADLGASAPVVPIPSAETYFARAIELERRLAAGEAVTDTDRTWLTRYQKTPGYVARKAMQADFGDAVLTA
jgi:transposase InsO family protein